MNNNLSQVIVKNLITDENGTSLFLTQENIQSHLCEIGKLVNLTNLEIYDCGDLHLKLDFLRKLTNLQNLSLPFNFLDDDDIVYFEPLHNLTRLELAQIPLTGTGFKNVKLNKLNTLILTRVNLNYEGIIEICNALPNLQVFDYMDDCGNFDETCLIEICTRLKFLHTISLCDVNCIDYDSLTLCPALRDLSLHCTANPCNYIGFPNKKPKFNPKYDAINKFPILPNLCSLSISVPFSKVILPQINAYQSLKVLNFSNLDNDLPYNLITTLTKLDNLSIHAYLENNDLNFLSKMPQLKSLDLRCNHKLDINAALFFADLKNLHSLNIHGTKIRKKQLVDLKKHVINTCDIHI